MIDERILSTTRHIFSLFVAGDYLGLETVSRGVRLSAKEIEKAVLDYGRHLVMPPDQAFSSVDVVEVMRSELPTRWSVRMDFWTREEGRSDLALHATYTDCAESMLEVEIDNIRVP